VGDRWHATASADALSCPRRTTVRRALSSARDVPHARLHSVSPPLLAGDARTPIPHDSLGGAQVPFFEFLNDRRGADVQDAGGVTNPTGIHGHRNDLLFDVWGLTGIGIIKQKGAPWA
jgi:hypothetical protein